MLETFLSPVIAKLIELLEKEVKLLASVHEEVRSLRLELEIMEPLLRDAEMKSAEGKHSDAVELWLRQLREEALKIEDAVEGYLHHIEVSRRQGRFCGSLLQPCLWMNSLIERCDIASKVKKIKSSLQQLKERSSSYGLKPFEPGGTSNTATEDIDLRTSSLFVGDDELVGIDESSKQLEECLVKGTAERMVISLEGEGGIGKTTLAMKVYKDAKAKRHFDCHVWITVSKSYTTESILQTLKKEFSPETKQSSGESITELFAYLRTFVENKRYVVVFDDVWKIGFWEEIKAALPENNNGSRIIVTTRKSSVVESFKETSSDFHLKLAPWPEDQAMELFSKKAFRFKSDKSWPSELLPQAIALVKKCQGLPLVISVVAGILSKKEDIEIGLRNLNDNLNFELIEKNKHFNILKILMLSYHDLPHHLRLCFLYFGIFPEDCFIRGKNLYRLWIAEGFINSKQNMILEKVAEEYLDELISRNLVSFEMRFGFSRFVKIHDLIREVILDRIEDWCFCQIFNENETKFMVSRRLSISGSNQLVLKNNTLRQTRSVSLFNVTVLTSSFLVDMFGKFKLLKVLNFENAPIDNLPEEVGDFIFLKYLCLRGTKVRRLPKSIGRLRALQTLDVSGTLVKELPIQINELLNLRHLSAFPPLDKTEYGLASYCGVTVPKGIGKLKELQTLTRIEADHGRTDFAEELQELKNLRALHVSKITAGMGTALRESIGGMDRLEELFLSSVNENETIDLSHITPPPLLCYVKLNCLLTQFPPWISKLRHLLGLNLNFSRLTSDPLTNLEDLPRLRYFRLYQAYDGVELHFKSGGFKKLKQLELRKLDQLQVLKIDQEALPVLEKLVFGPSPKMLALPSDIKHLGNLKSLEILDMPREFVLSLQPYGGSDHGKIEGIPAVSFGYYTGKGEIYNWYRPGSSELLRLLEDPNNQIVSAQ